MRVHREPREGKPSRPLAVVWTAVNLWLANLDVSQG
jgi:hypothetical protein